MPNEENDTGYSHSPEIATLRQRVLLNNEVAYLNTEHMAPETNNTILPNQDAATLNQFNNTRNEDIVVQSITPLNMNNGRILSSAQRDEVNRRRVHVARRQWKKLNLTWE